MNDIIINDAKNYPDLFIWNGPLDAEFLEEWMEERDIQLPEDMAEFWKLTGGGNIFESEDLVGPLGAPEFGLDFDATNEWLRGAGMPDIYIVFCSGSFLGAIRTTDNRYVLLDNIMFDELGEYDSFDEWYQNTVRKEYASQYNL
ncbi:MAG: SMI1/KNR4 family protein [Syntrophothermus sp.]